MAVNGEATESGGGPAAAAPGADRAGPETVLTQGEDGGAQGRAVITVDQSGLCWVFYMHQPPGASTVDEVRCLRGAQVASRAG